MMKKLKNREVEEVLTNATHLGTYAMPGDLTLAIIGARKALKNAFENYTEACKQIGESRCERDTNGNSVAVFLKDEQGNDLLNHPKKLKFKDVATELAALEELRKLGEKEVEFDAKEISTTVIEELKNITPIQMEAITALVELR